jgi:hypothetical protein
MPTGAQTFKQVAGGMVDTYNTRYNQILAYLMSQEQINPGALTALIDQIRSNEISIQRERDAISRLQLEGMKADDSFLLAMKKARIDLDKTVFSKQAEASIERGKLRTTFVEEKNSQKTTGAGAIPVDTSYTDARDKDVVGDRVIVDNDEQKQSVLKNYLVQFYQGNLADKRNSIVNEPIAVAEFDALVDAELRQAGDKTTRLPRFAGVDLDQAVNEAKSELRLGLKTPEQAEEEYDAEVDSVISQVGTGGRPADIDVRLQRLGIDDPKALLQPSEAIPFDPQNYNEKLGRAAFNSRILPQYAVEGEDGEIVSEYAEFGTFPEFQQALLDTGSEDHEKALDLYKRTLFKQDFEINLLADGSYPARLVALQEREAALEGRRTRLDDLMDRQRAGERRDFADIKREADQIYRDLYVMGKGQKMKEAATRIDEMTQGKSAEEVKKLIDDLPIPDAQRRRVGRLIARGARQNLKEIREEMKAVDPLALNLRGDLEQGLADEDRITVDVTQDDGTFIQVGKVTQKPLEDMTLRDLYLESEGKVSEEEYQAFGQVVDQLERAAIDGKLPKRATSQMKVLVEDLLGSDMDATEIFKQAGVTTFQKTIETPQEVQLASATPAPTPSAFDGNVGTFSPAGTRTELELMALGTNVADAANVAAKDATFGEGIISPKDFNKAMDDAVVGGLSPVVGDDAVKVAQRYSQPLADLGRLGAGTFTIDQIKQIVPEAKANDDVLLAAAALARNGYNA